MYFEVKYKYELRFLVLIKYNIIKNVKKIKVSYLGGHYDQMVTDSKTTPRFVLRASAV